MSTSVPTTSVPSPPRSARPLAARKQQTDAAWFSTNTTTSVTSAKRQAVDRVEGEPRNKRKRVGPTLQTTSQLGRRVDKPQERQNDELPVVSVVLSCAAHEGSAPQIPAESPNRRHLSTRATGHKKCMMQNLIMVSRDTDGFFDLAGRGIAPVSRPIRPHSCGVSITA